MAERMFLEIPINPEKMGEFIEALTPALKDTINFEGCQHLDFWTSEDKTRCIFHEVWETRAHQEKYFAWRVETGLVDALGPFVTGEPKVTWLNTHEYPAG